MTLAKAIREYQAWVDSDYHADMRPHINALRLGYEALKFLDEWRLGRYFSTSYLLPGETKE